MTNSELKNKWFSHYQSAEEQLNKMTEVKGSRHNSFKLRKFFVGCVLRTYFRGTIAHGV